MPIFLFSILPLAALVLWVIVSRQPSGFTIARSALVSAEPAAVFAQVNDFHRWQAWSPWLKLDPAVQMTYDGAPSGVGAKYAWSGNKKIGEGRMAISESHPPNSVRLSLEFLRPWKASNTCEFTFVPEGSNQTRVNWAMTGNRSFMEKVMALFIDFDKLVGKDFQEGLAKMKAVAEAKA